MIASVLAASLLVQPHNPVAGTRALLETKGYTPGQPFTVGLEVQLEEGWHVYWSNPGDSGMGTSVQWKLPPGWKADELQFPTPKSFEGGGSFSFGYEGTVVFLATLTPPSGATGTAKITANLAMLACEESCLPASQTLTFEIKPGSGPGPEKELLAAWRRKLPAPWSLATTPSATAIPNGYRLNLPMAPGLDVERLGFFPAEPAVLSHSATIISAQKLSSGWVLDLRESEFKTKNPKKLTGLVAPLGKNGQPSAPGYWISVPVR